MIAIAGNFSRFAVALTVLSCVLRNAAPRTSARAILMKSYRENFPFRIRDAARVRIYFSAEKESVSKHFCHLLLPSPAPPPFSLVARFLRAVAAAPRYAARCDVITKISNKSRTSRPSRSPAVPRLPRYEGPSFADFIAANQFSPSSPRRRRTRREIYSTPAKSYCRGNEIKVFQMNAHAAR